MGKYSPRGRTEQHCAFHWRGRRYGKSDIYFVCRVCALTERIKMSEWDIEECLWMPVHDLVTDDDIVPFNKGIIPADMPGMPHARRGRMPCPTSSSIVWLL